MCYIYTITVHVSSCLPNVPRSICWKKMLYLWSLTKEDVTGLYWYEKILRKRLCSFYFSHVDNWHQKKSCWILWLHGNRHSITLVCSSVSYFIRKWYACMETHTKYVLLRGYIDVRCDTLGQARPNWKTWSYRAMKVN